MTSDDCSNCELCTMTVERSERYYFDSFDTDGLRLAWETVPANMVDGLSTTPALTYINNRIQWLDTNTAVLQMDDKKPIIKVEIRAYSGTAIPAALCGPLFQYLRPVFIAGQGDTHSFNPTYPAPGSSGDSVPNWSQWFNITTDTNAPATWTWADVIALDMDTWMVRTICGDPNGCYCFKVEIRVTWTESVSIRYPEWGGIRGSLSKNIDMFNLWKTTVKTRDNGLNNQAYQLKGLAVSCESIACFPLCFPFCFIPEMQIAFQTVHDWIENHDEVTISCYGECADGIYIIKNLSTHSTRHPYDYLWTLDLEKVTDS